MSDTASQKAPARETLQDEINYQTSEAGGNMHTFIIKDKKGGCVLPDFVSARLINCEVNALNVVGGNLLSLEGCTVSYNNNSAYNVINSTVIAQTTKFDAPITFLNSKVEFSSLCVINQTLTFTDTSYLKTSSNEWKAGTKNKEVAISASNGSRVESVRDKWTGWTDKIWRASDNSIIKVTNAIDLGDKDSKGSFGVIDGNSVLILSHATKDISLINNTTPLFVATKNSRIELYNCSSLITDHIIFKLTDSRAIVRNIPTMRSNKRSIGELTNSMIDFSMVPSVESTSDSNNMFELVNSTITFSSLSALKSKGTVFNLNQSNINFVSNSFDYNSSSAIGATIESTKAAAIIAINSKLFCKNLKYIKSATHQAITLTKSSFNGVNITDIMSGDTGGTIEGDTAYLNLTNVKNITGKGSNGITLTKSKALLLNVETIKSVGSAGAGINATNSSSVICRNIKTVYGPDKGVAADSSSSVIFKGKGSTITGQKISGVSVGTSCRVSLSDITKIEGVLSGADGVTAGKGSLSKSRISIKDVKEIKGNLASGNGISIQDGDLFIDNSGLEEATVSGGTSGITLYSNNGVYNATIIGPMTVKGPVALSAKGYQVYEQGILWDGDISLNEAILEGILTKCTRSFIGTRSYTNFLNSEIDSDVNLTSSSVMKLITSSVGGAANLTQSIVDATLSTLKAATLNNRAGLIMDSSNVGDVSLSDSYFRGFGSKTGAISLDGKSSAFGGSSQSATINFLSGDATYTDPIAYFVTAGGDLVLQADQKIRTESLVFEGNYRDDHIQESISDITIKSTNGNIKFEAPQGSISLTAGSQVSQIVSGSSVIVTTDSITGTSDAISWN